MSMEYVFPMLSVHDTALHLGLLFNQPTDESFLKNPDPIQWQKMLAHMLCILTDCPEDALLKQPSLSAEFEHVELQAESIPVIHLVQSLRYLMHDIGCSDFSAGDIFKPTPYKVRKICSGLINFARFEQMKQPDIEQIKLDTESEKENYGMIQKENEELKQKINQLKAQRAEQEPELNKIRDQKESTHVRVNEVMHSKTQLQKGITEVKTTVAEQVAKTDEMRNQLLKRSEEVEMLSQKIVQSPSKVRAEQDGLKQQVQMLRETGDRKQQRFGELDQQIQNDLLCGTCAEKGQAILEAIDASVEKENNIQKEINQTEDKIQEVLLQNKEIDAQRTTLQDKHQSRQEKLARLSFQHQSRMNNFKEQEEMLKSDKDLFMQKQDSNSEVKVKLMHYKKRLEKEDKDEHRKVEEKTSIMFDLYSQLLNGSDESHRNIAENWEKIKKCFKTA